MDAVLGVLFTVLVGLLAVPTYIHYESAGVNNARIVTTAEQMQSLSQAATAYVQANYSDMALPTVITVGQLQQGGYLPNSFSPTNPYGQTWSVQAVKPSSSQAGLVEAIVTSSGGTAIPAKQASEIAAQAGAQGGFVPYPNQYGNGTSTNVAMGAYGGWQVPLNSPLANPGSGHLVSLLYFNNGTLENDYLYRVAVPGQPQLNSMATSLNMSANDIAQANVAQAQVANLGTDNGTAVVGAECSPGGAIAAEAPTAGTTSTTGNLLDCVQNSSSSTGYVWATLGGGGLKPCGSPEYFNNFGTYQITVPSGCTAVDAILYGAGGGPDVNTQNYASVWAGNGALVQGETPVSAGSNLTVVVGQGGSETDCPNNNPDCSGGGGGLSAICTGTACSSTSALLVAGGGGGGTNFVAGWEVPEIHEVDGGPTLQEIANGGPNPPLGESYDCAATGGAGYGGSGQSESSGGYAAATPWGSGSGNPNGSFPDHSSGGYGGGGSGGSYNGPGGGGGGGGGFPGGCGGGLGNIPVQYPWGVGTESPDPGQGGTDYAAPSVSHVIQLAGGGGSGQSAQDGSVILQFLQ